MSGREALAQVLVLALAFWIVSRPKVWAWVVRLPARLLWRATLGRRRWR